MTEEGPAGQKRPDVDAVESGAATSPAEHSRRDAIRRLMKLGIVAPTATVLINMKVNNAFAEPGS